MDVDKMLAELKAERAQLEEAILTLERLARGRGKRRGRPPTWLKDAQAVIAEQSSAGAANGQSLKRRGRPQGSGKLRQNSVNGN